MEIPVTGTLKFSVEGTATSGSDYVDLPCTPTTPCSVPVNGTSVNIDVTLMNDTDVSEEIESIILQLEPGLGYQVGALNRHTIFIIDDDALWRGSLEIDSGLVPITMALVNGGSGYTGSITSDGLGTFPLDPQGDPQTWSATVSLTDTTFSASVDPITMPAASSGAIDTSFSRTFTFSADEGGSPTEHLVAPRVIRGDFLEDRSFPGQVHLDHTLAGFFSLMKEIPIPSTFEAPLEDVP